MLNVILVSSLLGCDDPAITDPLGPEALASAAASQKGPSNLLLTALPGAISVGWQDNSPNESGFEILRSTTGANGSFSSIATTGPNTTAYLNAGLSPVQEYCYEVQAVTQKRVIGVSNTACAPPQALEPLAVKSFPAKCGIG
jgi:hypothetical protein